MKEAAASESSQNTYLWVKWDAEEGILDEPSIAGPCIYGNRDSLVANLEIDNVVDIVDIPQISFGQRTRLSSPPLCPSSP